MVKRLEAFPYEPTLAHTLRHNTHSLTYTLFERSLTKFCIYPFTSVLFNFLLGSRSLSWAFFHLFFSKNEKKYSESNIWTVAINNKKRLRKVLKETVIAEGFFMDSSFMILLPNFFFFDVSRWKIMQRCLLVLYTLSIFYSLTILKKPLICANSTRINDGRMEFYAQFPSLNWMRCDE